jgi:hypothetical protein
VSPSVPKGDILSPRAFLNPHLSCPQFLRIAPSLRDPSSIATDCNPQGHSVFQAPSPAAIPARLRRRHPDGAWPSAAWTCTARLVKVGPLECPGPPTSGRAMLERLEGAACRTEMPDRRLNAKPPAYVQRALAETRVLACDQGYTCGRPRCSMVWFGYSLEGGFASGVCRNVARHTPGQDHVTNMATADSVG